LGLWTIDVLCRWYSFLFLTVLGFKLLAPNMKSIGNIKYTLLALWLISGTSDFYRMLLLLLLTEG
jgi:hypothetical protein